MKIFGAPNTTASSSVIAEAFDYAGDLGVDVVNASLGGLGTSQIDHRRDRPRTRTRSTSSSAGNSADDAALLHAVQLDRRRTSCASASSDNRDAARRTSRT